MFKNRTLIVLTILEIVLAVVFAFAFVKSYKQASGTLVQSLAGEWLPQPDEYDEDGEPIELPQDVALSRNLAIGCEMLFLAVVLIRFVFIKFRYKAATFVTLISLLLAYGFSGIGVVTCVLKIFFIGIGIISFVYSHKLETSEARE